MIIDHTLQSYIIRRYRANDNRWNGAYYYSVEIVKNIIPRVKTTRNWITINQKGEGLDHSIVFVHNNKHPENYEWMARYKDLVLVCGVPETVPKVAHLGRAVYLPLSIDLEDVLQYKRPKTKDTAYVGRQEKMSGCEWPLALDVITGLPREKLLPAMAEYRRVYAVGRCAIEARALGCEVLYFDPRYPDPSVWEVLDNRDAAKILQKQLDEIDGK